MITLPRTILRKDSQVTPSLKVEPELAFDSERRIVTLITGTDRKINLTRNSKVDLDKLSESILQLGHPQRPLKVDLQNVGGIDIKGLKVLSDLVGNRKGVPIEFVNVPLLVANSLNRLPSLARRAS